MSCVHGTLTAENFWPSHSAWEMHNDYERVTYPRDGRYYLCLHVKSSIDSYWRPNFRILQLDYFLDLINGERWKLRPEKNVSEISTDNDPKYSQVIL